MKIGSELQFEVPDHCPENCPFSEDKKFFSMTSMCFRCPIVNCNPFDYIDEKGTTTSMCLVEPTEFRDDWAAEWEAFFKQGSPLEMKFSVVEDDNG